MLVTCLRVQEGGRDRMRPLYRPVRPLLSKRHGVTAAEYAVIPRGIVIVVAASASLPGTGLSRSFSRTTALF